MYIWYRGSKSHRQHRNLLGINELGLSSDLLEELEEVEVLLTFVHVGEEKGKVTLTMSLASRVEVIHFEI